MAATHTDFVRANAASPVVRIATGARATTYHLEDGNVFRLERREMEALSDFVTRQGFTIRLAAKLRQRLGE